MNKIIQKLIVFGIVLSAGLFSAHSAFAAGPTMIANGASNVTQTQADLTGFFTAKVPLTDVWFDYGPTPIPGFSTPHQSMGNLLNGSFSATVTNLIPNTTYYFRSYGINANGTGFSTLLTFTTLAYQAPTILTTPATAISSTDATLNASFNGNGSAVDTWFEYSTNANLAGATKTPVITQGSVSGTASDIITGLKPNTKYYFRAIAKNVGGTTRATSILNFTTTANAPKICTISNFSASTLSVKKGGVVVLDWTSTNCTSGVLTLAALNVSSMQVGVNSSATFSPVATTTYTLTLTDSVTNTTDSRSITVTFNQTPAVCTISNFSSSLQTIVKGNSATLNWNTSNCTNASISPYGNVSTSGSLVVTPNATTTYTLTAWNTNGINATMNFTVVVTSGGNGYQSPTLITNAPTNVSTNSAILQGTLNGNGYATTAWIEFPCGNSSGRFGTQSTSGYVNLSGQVYNLAPNTTYCYQVVGRDVNNTPVYGNQYTFSTYGAGGGTGGPFTKPGGGSTMYPPVVTTYSAQGVTDTLAVLTGYVNGNGGFTNAWFEYGTSNSFGYNTVTQSYNPSGNISININGLLPNTTYYYRLVARNSAGSSYGTTLSFTTTAWFNTDGTNNKTLKAVTTLVSKVTNTTATLNGIVYKGTTGTTYASFEYGTNVNALGIKTMKYPLAPGASTKFSSAISSLSPDTIYYFRIVSENNGVVSKGDIFYFKTNKVAGTKTTSTVVGSTKNGTPKNTDSETGSGISVGDTTNTDLSASAGKSGSFFPTTFIGWLILTLIILLIVIIIRLIVSRRHNQHPPAH